MFQVNFSDEFKISYTFAEPAARICAVLNFSTSSYQFNS